MSGEDQLASVNMDSILMSVAVWGIHVKLYDISLVKQGAVVLLSHLSHSLAYLEE